MSDFEQAIGALLSDPSAMGKILSLAQELGGEGAADATPEKEPGEASTPPTRQKPEERQRRSEEKSSPPEDGGGSGAQADATLFEGLDPGMIQQIFSLLRAWEGQNETGNSLLSALAPYLKASRREKLRQAMRLAKVTKLARTALGNWKGGEPPV